ncbi:MAG TPA: prolyl oligopeptidase family serine peptidase, partial [Polyangiales bacterium]|nr:prolyl oligopeptidase family serine peptidase [Polyangiales bacterium]
MPLRATWLSLLLLAACTQSPVAPVPPPSQPTAAPAPANVDELTRLNAEIAKDGVRETVAGVTVEDPYRALEQDSPRTQAWIAAQTQATEAALAKARDPKAEARLAELLAIGQLGSVQLAGDRVFFTLREGSRERPALFVHDRKSASAVQPDQPIVDPLGYGPNAALDYAVASYDGSYVAFGISDSGDERATLRVYDVRNAKVLPDTIAHAKWSSIDWLSDASGFYYTRYPKDGESDWNAEQPDSYFPRLFFHALGTDPASDPRVFAGEKPVDFPGAGLDETDRYLVINNHRSWTQSDVWLWDRGSGKRRPIVPEASALQPIVRDRDNTSFGQVHRGQLYLVTNIDAPKKRVVRVAPAQASDPARWQTLIPESQSTLEDVVFTRNFAIVHAIQDVRSKLSVFDLQGQAKGEIALPMPGRVAALSGTRDRDELAFVWSSFFHPPTLFVYDLERQKLSELYRVKSDFDAGAYELVQQSVKSRDGTPINVYFGRKRGAAPDANTPVLIRGYGGFDISLLPEFTRSALYWLERGGIYAEANLRGGGEFGETWHRAGMLTNKLNVFDDFEAVIRWFASSGISNPARIAITGGSNGGLLMGALITRAPDAFAAAASYVGLYDMLRYPLFPPAALWTSEYGDPNDPALARYLLSY